MGNNITLDIPEDARFNWRPVEQMTIPGKYIVLNMTPANQLMIGTAVLHEGLDSQVIHDILKWAIAFDDFPDVEVTIEPEAA